MDPGSELVAPPSVETGSGTFSPSAWTAQRADGKTMRQRRTAATATAPPPRARWPLSSLPLLSLLALLLLLSVSLLPPPASASCRVGSLRCNSDRDCWSGGTNSSVPSNCKCCTGFPFPQGGECRTFCDRNAFLYTIELQDRLKKPGSAFGGLCNGGWGGKK